MSFSEFPDSLLCGEVQQLSVCFTNTGHHPLETLNMACTCPEFFTLGSEKACVGTVTDKCLYETLSNTSESDSEEYTTECPPVKFVHQVGTL